MLSVNALQPDFSLAGFSAGAAAGSAAACCWVVSCEAWLVEALFSLLRVLRVSVEDSVATFFALAVLTALLPAASTFSAAALLAGVAAGDSALATGVFCVGICSGGAFVVYVGTHGDHGAHRANVILPGAAYTEKSGTYVNTEGRVQQTSRAGFAPGEAREDWAIVRALSDVLGRKLPFDSLAQLRRKLYAEYPHLARLDDIAASDPADLAGAARLGGRLNKGVFTSPVRDFYLTNPIARASAVMAECSALAKTGSRQAAE